VSWQSLKQSKDLKFIFTLLIFSGSREDSLLEPFENQSLMIRFMGGFFFSAKSRQFLFFEEKYSEWKRTY
jgi:hypothetical protein